MRYFSLFMLCGRLFCLYLLFDLLNTIDQMWFLQQLMIGMLSFVFIMRIIIIYRTIKIRGIFLWKK